MSVLTSSRRCSVREGWATVTLGELLDVDGLRNGVSPATDGTVDGEVLTLSAVTGGKFDPSARKRARFARAVPESQQVREGLLLFSRGNGNPDFVARAVLADRDLPGVAFPDTVIAGRLDAGRCDPRAICHLWKAPEIRRQVAAISRTTNGTFKVNQKGLSQVRLPLPPLPEQRRIAAILDQAGALRAKRCEAIVHLDTLVRAIFFEMFVAASNLQEVDRRATLVELCRSADDVKCGPFGTQLRRSEFREEGVPLWGIKNVNSRFDLPAWEFLEHSTARRLKNFSLLPGDIVMTRKGTVGNCAVYPANFPAGVMHSDLLRIRVDSQQVLPGFLSHQLQHSSDVARQLSLVSSGAIMPGVNVTKLKSLIVSVPPIESQVRFVDRLRCVDRQRDLYRAQAREFDAALASLQHGAFSGLL